MTNFRDLKKINSQTGNFQLFDTGTDSRKNISKSKRKGISKKILLYLFLIKHAFSHVNFKINQCILVSMFRLQIMS
jgi:hypothetical protein